MWPRNTCGTRTYVDFHMTGYILLTFWLVDCYRRRRKHRGSFGLQPHPRRYVVYVVLGRVALEYAHCDNVLILDFQSII